MDKAMMAVAMAPRRSWVFFIKLRYLAFSNRLMKPKTTTTPEEIMHRNSTRQYSTTSQFMSRLMSTVSVGRVVPPVTVVK